MAIKSWWQSDPAEIYWMEITDRDDPGEPLRAPVRSADGKESASYTLTSYVKPGDRVFHWHRGGLDEPAIVGWSDAIGPLRTIRMAWRAHGTSGRNRIGQPAPAAAWEMPLRGFTRLDRPITRTEINVRRAEILTIRDSLVATMGNPLYFPFMNYADRELRAFQGYLMKFPAALVDLLFSGRNHTPAGQRPKPERAQGYQTSAAARAAIEQHAVEVAVRHYRTQGAKEIEELGKPYDLRVTIAGQVRHVEVKGSVGADLATVELTQGEVDHAHRWHPTDLFVVDNIVLKVAANNQVRAVGGRSRIWSDWQPEESALRPTHLRYILPEGADQP